MEMLLRTPLFIGGACDALSGKKTIVQLKA
jgi:hypothetical protein